MPNYGNIVKNTNPEADGGGYKNVVLIARRDDFDAIAVPTASAAIGDTLKITTAHTFTGTAGFNSWDCKQHSVTLKSTSVGDDGAKQQEWAGEFIILGDSASTDEQLRRTLNDDIILLLKDSDCQGTNAYIQLGDECQPPSFSVEFDGKTTKEGKKEYKVTVTGKKKFFYSAAVTMASA
jgi:hypothetical protein